MKTARNNEQLIRDLHHLKELKLMQKEIEENIKALQQEFIDILDEECQDSMVIDIFKISYKLQARTSIAKKALEADMPADAEKYTKETIYPVFRIS